MQSYPFHPLADLFPLIKGTEFDELVSSIKSHGLHDPIVLLNGTILDGRNRYRACGKAGIEPRFEDYTGDDPHAFVIDKNIHRRHLNESQRAMVAAAMANLTHGGDRKSEEIKVEISTLMPVTLKEAAELLNVDRGTVAHAKTVLTRGTAEEIQAVRDGKAAASTIAKQIRQNVPDAERHLGGHHGPVAKAAKEKANKVVRMKSQIWSDFRTAITAIGDLPHPADVAAAARTLDRSGFVDARIFSTLQWIKEFANEWSKRSQTSADAGHDADADDYAGTGN